MKQQILILVILAIFAMAFAIPAPYPVADPHHGYGINLHETSGKKNLKS